MAREEEKKANKAREEDAQKAKVEARMAREEEKKANKARAEAEKSRGQTQLSFDGRKKAQKTSSS